MKTLVKKASVLLVIQSGHCGVLMRAAIRNRVGHEIRQLLPVWIFFFLAFNLLRLTQSVIIREYGLQVTTPSLVLVGSLIVAKTFLFIDWFRFVERFRNKPLIYGVLWKTAIYYVGSFIIYILEQLIERSIRHHGFGIAWTQVNEVVGTARFWIVQLWLVLLLLAFTSAREMVRALGKSQMIALWFGRGAVASNLL